MEDTNIEDVFDILDAQHTNKTIMQAMDTLDATERYVIEEAFGFITGKRKVCEKSQMELELRMTM